MCKRFLLIQTHTQKKAMTSVTAQHIPNGKIAEKQHKTLTIVLKKERENGKCDDDDDETTVDYIFVTPLFLSFSDFALENCVQLKIEERIGVKRE